MTRNALVTGGNGFVAQWVMRAMLRRGWTVTAAGIGQLAPGVLTDDEHSAITWRTMDITAASDIRNVVEAAKPDVVVHLAAISHVPEALGNPGLAYEVNTVGTVRLLAELAALRRREAIDPVVLAVGSAEQYGRHAISEMPLHEYASQRPLTTYAATKCAQEVAALQACRHEKLRIICTRSFNHSGIGHPVRFLIPGLVARARQLPRSGGTLMIGNADIVRDFLHVTDVADAYLSLTERGESGEAYNVSSGIGTSVRTLAQAVIERLQINAAVEVDPGLVRSVDVPVLVGSSEKLRTATGWAPSKTVTDIIDDLIHASTH